MLADYTPQKLEKLVFSVTTKCNLFCKHCCFCAEYYDENNKDNIEINMDVLESILQLKPKYIDFTGGEPLIADNFSEFMQRLNLTEGISFALCTNATLITEKNVESLVECFHKFDISIDGYTEKLCDDIRGKGTFKKVLHAVELLKKHNAKEISLSMAITEKSQREPFQKFCENLNVKFMVRDMTMTGRAKQNKLIEKNEIYNFFDPNCTSISHCNSCEAGKSSIAVIDNGDLYPCILFVEDQFKMGNILEDELNSILRWDLKDKWFRHFSQFVSGYREECKKCEVKDICWDCPGDAKLIVDNTKLQCFTDSCKEKHDILLKRIWE